MLEVSGICKSYGKHRILNGVSFSAGPASAWESSEPMAAERPRFCRSWQSPAGRQREHRINGTEILGRSGAAADLTAYVPQENPLIGELSVKDNLLLWHRGSRKEMEKDLTEGCSSVRGSAPC